jgi:hypothetical protein
MSNRPFVHQLQPRADVEKIRLSRLKMYLAPLRRGGRVDVWDDTRIAPGSHWEEEIAQSLEAASDSGSISRARFSGV